MVGKKLYGSMAAVAKRLFNKISSFFGAFLEIIFSTIEATKDHPSPL